MIQQNDKILIIFAHPNIQGHNTLILEQVIVFLEEHNITYEIIDLYKLKYNPVLKKEELYTSGNRKISNQTKEFQKKISATKKLIFIFPIWWNGMPAILKGFFDRVFTGRFAFKYRTIGKLNIPVKLLKGKKSTVFFSTASPKIITKTILRNEAKKNIRKDILEFCGIKTKAYQLDNATYLTEKTVLKAKKIVSKGLHWLLK